jgi:nucleoside-diphosphate-sugar epimerase
MRIFIAGASGAIGSQPVPQLVARGHEVVGTTRSAAKTRIDPNPPADAEQAVAALRHLEDAETGIGWADGIALRYGGFYGPGTNISAAPDAVVAEVIRKRRLLVGGGGGGWSLPPRRGPGWLVRLVAGKAAVHLMTQARGISSEKAKRELGRRLQYPSWRTGFADGLS